MNEGLTKIDKLGFFNFLKKNNIRYKNYNHPRVYTVEESKSIKEIIEGANTKNLFLKSKKNNFYLFSLLQSSKVDLKKMNKELSLGNISFASKDYLMKYLGLLPGSVSPFGLINDKENIVKFFLDKKINDYSHFNFHPLDNDATISIPKEGFFKYMELINKKVIILNTENYNYYTI